MAEMPKVPAREPVQTEAVEAKTYPDLCLMSLEIATDPRTLKKSVNVRMRAFNFETKELAPRGSGAIKRLTIPDVEAAADQIPALLQAVGAIGACLSPLMKRDDILKLMAPHQKVVATQTARLAALDEAEATHDDRVAAVQAEIDAVQAAIAAEEDEVAKAQLQADLATLNTQKTLLDATAAEYSTQRADAQNLLDEANAALEPLQAELTPVEEALGM